MTTVRSLKPDDSYAGQLGRRRKPRYLEFLGALIGDQINIWEPDSVLQILKCLRQGGFVQMMLDGPYTTNPVIVQYLGKEHRGSTAVFRIARQTGARILPFWYQGTHRQLKVEIGPPLEWDKNRPELDFRQVLDQLEQRVVESPDFYYLWEQWR